MKIDVHSLYGRRNVNRWERMSVGDMLERVTYSFPDKEAFVHWWYNSNEGLGDKSPDQLCKEGKQNKLESILMDIFTGAQGG